MPRSLQIFIEGTFDGLCILTSSLICFLHAVYYDFHGVVFNEIVHIRLYVAEGHFCATEWCFEYRSFPGQIDKIQAYECLSEMNRILKLADNDYSCYILTLVILSKIELFGCIYVEFYVYNDYIILLNCLLSCYWH